MIKISVSIVCFNSPREQLSLLLRTLISAVRFMRQHLEVGSIPVYLIDNSRPALLSIKDFKSYQEELDELSVELNLIGGHGNIGYGCAHNLVLEKLESDFHLMLNPDVTLEKDALFEGVLLLSNNTDMKMLGPCAVNSEGEKQHLCKRQPTILVLLLRALVPRKMRHLFATHLDHYEMRDLPEDRPTDNIPFLSGCFMLIDTSAFRKVRGFDRGYFLYFEDFDLSLRINELGSLVYAPMVRVTHLGGNTFSKGLWHIAIFSLSAYRFFSNHGWRVF